jgi:hypothetical protein
MYAAGEAIPEIALLVGWSAGRVRKVLREAGFIVTEAGAGDGPGGGSFQEDRRRLLAAGWKAQLRGGIVVWHRPDGRGSWYTQDAAIEILEAMKEEEEGRHDGPPKPRAG